MTGAQRDSLFNIVTPIKIPALKRYLELSKFDKHKTEQLVQGFTHGFDIGYRGPHQRRDFAPNLPLTVGTEKDIWDKLMKEIDLGRHAGPYLHPPFEYFVKSPIGLVPKDGGKQTRLIFHLSYDFGTETHQKSINWHTPEDFCSVQYRDLDYAVRTCLGLGIIQDHSKPIFFGKSDLRSHFRLLLVLPNQRCFC